jgi:hypothetical protein
MINFNVEWQGHAIAEAAGAFFNPICDVVIARTEGARLFGGAVYQGFTGASIGMHTAGFVDNWVNRDLLWVCFHYPFVQLGCSKVLGTVASYNHKALAFDMRLGFKEEAVITGTYPDGNTIVMGMRRDDCRWLGIKPASLQEGKSSNGQQSTSPGSAGLHAADQSLPGPGR